MSDILHFPSERVRDASDRFPPIIAQETLDAQEADEKIRAFYRSVAKGAWAVLRLVLLVIGSLGLLGLIIGG